MNRRFNVVTELFDHGRELISHPAFRAHPIRTIARAGSWAYHCAIGRPVTIHYREPAFLLRVPAKFRSSGGTSAFVLREDYEPEYRLLLRILRPGMVFVDVGSNAGAFSFAASRMVGAKGCVLAFEPGPNCYRLLSESVRLNQFANVRIFNQALSNVNGKAELFMHYGKENSLGLGRSESQDVVSIPITTMTLQHIYDQQSLDRLDFIKIDAEGAQQLVIEGAIELIKTHLPSFLIKNNIGACRRLELEPSGGFNHLRNLGYQFASATRNGTVCSVDCPEETHHVFCVPDSRFKQFMEVCNAKSYTFSNSA
jgi:FkbM family methyltransferase